MSDHEDFGKGDSESTSQTCVVSPGADSATVLPAKSSMETVSSINKSPELVVPDDPHPTEAVSEADDTPSPTAVSEANETLLMEAVSDTDDPPAMDSVSDTDDPPAIDSVSDVDDPPTMEGISDADDPSANDVSDADDLPTVEVTSDVDDPPAVEDVSGSAVSSTDNTASPCAADTVSGKPPSIDAEKVTSDDDTTVGRGAYSECSNPSVNKESDEVVDKSAHCSSIELDASHSKSVQSSKEIAGSTNNKTSALSALPSDSKDSESRTGESSDADVGSKDSNKVKSPESIGEKCDNVKLSSSSSSSKTSSAVPNVKAEFSDNEENAQLSPQNKLLEVIFKEQEEDEDNMEAFIPEVECTIEDTEGNSDGLPPTQEKGDSSTVTAEQSTPGKDESVSKSISTGEATTTTNNNNENKENGACEDSYLGSYSAESCDVDETMQTYAKEFLYSDTSSLGPEPDAAGPEDGSKRTTLSRFSNIVKTVGSADYSLLQEMYKLLYLRNPWDTKEVLSARILDFSGFHFAQDSEDYFNREVTLRGMPQKTLEAIAHLLCLGKPISARSNKQRVNLAIRIMKFLMNPVKPKRNRPASSSSKSKSVTSQAVESSAESASKSKSAKPKSRKSTPIRTASKSCKKEAEVKVKLERENSSIPVPEVKVELTKMEPSEMCRAAKLKLADTKLCTPVDENSDSNSKTSKPSDADEATDTEDNTASSVPEEDIKKLKEFPEVLSNIEGTPDKILSDIHYLLYLEDASLKDLKSNVMEFRGFPVEDGPSEVDERKQFLEKMSDDIIKNITDTFYLESTNNKEDNIDLIIKFLKAPSKRYMKEAAEAPDKMLSEKNTELMDGLSDSDDSITCEIVQKKVDCIDLMSSGEEDEKEEEKEEKVTVKKEELPGRPAKRCLHDFETITKIVNTHPHEYLIDIYNLLYQRTCEPSTLRKEILEFTGFEFEKGSDEYIKRKQYLDRMQYNNVRRIFNTLIHNTRDVRVFSKPTMIGEIFQFLFKLPDTDTSIRPPPQKSNVVVPILPKEKEKVAVNPNLVNVVNKADPPQTPNNTRLSELKRVFQRVACFPCEYLVDVHKLLFMKDCDMKDIRQNIFAFKGFPFGVDSQEFKQRKMYLEYLTFHSLRKISSVLTTKNVDLRNSTKHELSTHLTKVLTEYTNTYMEAEAQEASSQAEEITAQANKAAAAAARDPNVEKIVVTPVIEGFQAASTNDSSLPKVVDIRSQSKEVAIKPKISPAVTSTIVVTTPVSKQTTSPQKKKVKTSNTERPITQTFEKIIIPTVDQPAKQRRRKKANPTQRITEAEALSKAEQMNSAMQFQDIHLPEVESLVRSYQQNPNLLSTLISRPQVPQMQALPQPVATSLGAAENIRANIRTVIEQKSQGPNIRSPLGTSQFPLQVLYPPQVRQPPPPNVTVGLAPRPAVPFQIIRPFSMQPTVQNLYYNTSILNSSSPPLEPIYKDDEPGDFVGALPVECILTEGGSGEPAAKKPKLAELLTAPQGSLARSVLQPTQPVQPMKKPFEKHIIESCENTPKPSASFHLKIRDAMTKAAEDEEDCDKPLASLVGHPNDKVLKQQICEIVENTDLQDITINGVIQKIFNMYPKFNLNYRKEFIKSTLRSLLYRLGEQEATKSSETDPNPDSSVSASSQGSSPKSQLSSPTKVTLTWSSASGVHKS